MRDYNAELQKVAGLPGEVPGAYVVKNPKCPSCYFQVIASNGLGWDHVSVCLRRVSNGSFVERCCTWEEMCYIKDLFFKKDETVVQYHPAEENYVNTHNFVLHLWRPQNVPLPLPEKEMV